MNPNLELLDRIDALTNIRDVPAGTRLVYHVGFLPRDRDYMVKIQGSDARARAALVDQAATLAWQLHEAGKVALTQKRITQEYYEYFATKSRR